MATEITSRTIGSPSKEISLSSAEPISPAVFGSAATVLTHTGAESEIAAAAGYVTAANTAGGMGESIPTPAG